MPQLRDAYGRQTIGPPTGDFGRMLISMGATSIIFGPHSRLGVYIDSETGTAPAGSPEQRSQRNKIAIAIRKKIPKELIVVGLYPDEVGHQIIGCVTALQWYPQAFGYDPFPLPPAQGYIFAQEYAGEGEGRKPTLVELAALIVTAKNRPSTKLIWVY